ncbi:unnamed protein product [Diplocarpon coronariae]
MGLSWKLRTIMAKVDDLYQKGALYESIKNGRLPQTTSHTLRATSLAKEQNLCFDALCIVQDDMSIKEQACNNTSAMRASAAQTIVAARGSDANFGSRGFWGLSEPRETEQVYQLLNRTNSMWREDMDHVNGSIHTRHASKSRVEELLVYSNPWSALSNYANVVSSHKRDRMYKSLSVVLISRERRLLGHFLKFKYLKTYPTFQSDTEKNTSFLENIGAAFSGFMFSLQPQFPAGFIYGLPEALFDTTLLWTPQTKATRR